jgi:hypothetical protein
MSRGIKRKRVILIPKSSFELDASPKVLTMFDWFKHESKVHFPRLGLYAFLTTSQKNSIKIKKGNDDTHSFLLQSISLWRNSGHTTETTCAAAARKYVSKILCESQRAQHIQQCSTTRALDFCYRVVSMSNNIIAMDVANILHAEDRFFSALHKILFVTKRCLETKHSLLYDVWLLSNNST